MNTNFFKIKKVILWTYLIISIFFFLNISMAETIKPKKDIKPHQVVKLQLIGLMKNDKPTKDFGIQQTWEFAHPNNKTNTGPIEKFKSMLKGNSYYMLIDHIEHKIEQVYLSQNLATFEVIILTNEKKYYKFKWQVEKYLKEGKLKDCWLTTVVSQPIPLGSSI